MPAPEAKLHLAAIVECSDDAIISKTLEGIITSWNAAAERMFGYTAEEAIGKHITMIIPKDRLREEEEIISKLRHGEKIDHFQTVRCAKNGDCFDISLTVSPIYDENKNVIGASKIARNITLQKQMEEELRAQREWFQVTLSSIGDAVITTDIHSRVTFLNPVAERLTGWTCREAIGKPLTDIFSIINEASRAPVDHPVDMVIKHGTVQGLANHTVLVSKDGSEYAIEDSAAPIRRANGELLGVVLVFHDVGERRVLEKELQHRTEMLTEKDRRKDEFLAMLSHELRNPLAPISNAAHIIKSPKVSDSMRVEACSMIERQIKLMTRLLDDLLDISRITHGKIELRRRRVALSEVIQAAVETATPFSQQRRQSIFVHLPESPIYLNGDAARLAQVFANLLNNAIKYSDLGKQITVEASAADGRVKVIVRDNGIGIPQDMLGKIFEMFSQVDTSMERSQGGLGIGLTLVKNLVEMHGGTIDAHSQGLGHGSEFVVTLPVLAAEQPREQDAPMPQLIASPETYRILVVDDGAASAKTLGWMLEILGHEVRLAKDGLEALAIAKQFLPEVVFLDIGLPGMNGYEVCKAMRQEPSLANTLIIAQTGWGQEEHRKLSKEAGFDQHLVKPIDIQALQSLLSKVKESDRRNVSNYA